MRSTYNYYMGMMVAEYDHLIITIPFCCHTGIDTDLRKKHKLQSKRKLNEVSQNSQAGMYMYMISLCWFNVATAIMVVIL